MATVSKQHALAAADLLRLPGTHVYLGYAPALYCLNSRLLLSWAPFIESASMNDHVLSVPGIGDFMTHATSLHTCTVEATCFDPLAAARFDELLSTCKAVTELHCNEAYMPCITQTTLHVLSLDIEQIAGQSMADSGAHQLLDILIVRLNTCGCQLDSLTLYFGAWPALGCQTCLPALKRLHVCFTVSEEVVLNLDWLCVQPSDHLTVELELDIPDSKSMLSMQAVHALQQINMQQLKLRPVSGFFRESQKVWGQLTTGAHVHIEGGLEVSCGLVALPVSPWIRITTAVQPEEPLLFGWSALAGSPVCMHLKSQSVDPCSVSILGFPGLLPHELSGKPWQFCVLGNVKVFGLPSSQRCRPGVYLLQNKAAILAGWTEES